MLQHFQDYISRQHLVGQADEVLLAVSGGRDSVCMAHLAHAAGLHFAIAHCNFHLRPSECDRDQHLTQQLADSLGVTCHVAHFDTAAYAASHGQSIEQAARTLRYSFFASLCHQHTYVAVATAHHREDSVETFFLNLLRGTGIAGLHGIQPTSHLSVPLSPTNPDATYPLTVIHPMLDFSRADIDAYISLHGIPYADDSTNFEPQVQRNRIRLQLMPLLRQLAPSFDLTMQANMARIADAETLMLSHIGQLRQQIECPYTPHLLTSPSTMLAYPIADLCRTAPQPTVLYELLRPYDFNATTVADMLTAMGNAHTGRHFLSHTHEAVLDRTLLVVAPHTAPRRPTITVTPCPTPSHFEPDSHTIYVDADTLQQPCTLRPWAEGDRFHPFGMKGSKLVSDYLKDAKINGIEKRHLWVLTDASGAIVWLIGLRADNRFRLAPGASRCLRISVRP